MLKVVRNIPFFFIRCAVSRIFSSVYGLTSFNDTLYFIANEGELWKSDGTIDGTVWIQSIGYVSTIFESTTLNNTLYFLANGSELWKSDGTTDGTLLVRGFDLNVTTAKPFSSFSDSTDTTFVSFEAVFHSPCRKGILFPYR